MKNWLKRSLFLRKTEAGDSLAISQIHGQSFALGWSEGDVHQMLVSRQSRSMVAESVGLFGNKRLVGFYIVRFAEDEAEILSIAVDKAHRSHGVGRRLVEDAMRQLAYDGIAKLFLEVDEDNAAAVRLYQGLGFTEIARREGYYRDTSGKRHTAVVMERKLS